MTERFNRKLGFMISVRNNFQYLNNLFWRCMKDIPLARPAHQLEHLYRVACVIFFRLKIRINNWV
jgi:hypothetical protein